MAGTTNTETCECGHDRALHEGGYWACSADGCDCVMVSGAPDHPTPPAPGEAREDTVHLLASPANAARLRRALVRAGDLCGTCSGTGAIRRSPDAPPEECPDCPIGRCETHAWESATLSGSIQRCGVCGGTRVTPQPMATELAERAIVALRARAAQAERERDVAVRGVRAGLDVLERRNAELDAAESALTAATQDRDRLAALATAFLDTLDANKPRVSVEEAACRYDALRAALAPRTRSTTDGPGNATPNGAGTPPERPDA